MAAQVALRRQMDDRSLIENNDDSRKTRSRAIERANDDIKFASTGKLKLYASCDYLSLRL